MDYNDILLDKYLLENIEDESPLLQKLDRNTQANILMPRMISGHLQGRILSMLSHMIQPRRILEIGTYTGYSAICLSEGLSNDGVLYTIDINEELADMVREYISEAKLEHKIKPIIGDARKIIPKLDDAFDMVFVDADKLSYPQYFDMVIDKVKIGGYILADNILWSGKVLTEDAKDKDLNAIKFYNQKLKLDKRVEVVILPIRDGISIARKISN